MWESAEKSRHDILTRLAIVHLIHEARGLDVYESCKKKFLDGGDERSGTILDQNHMEEVNHVAKAVKWFQYFCDIRGIDPIPTFHQLVRSHFRGGLKPPFNTEKRVMAGMNPEWYMPLVCDSKDTSGNSAKGFRNANEVGRINQNHSHEIDARLTAFIFCINVGITNNTI